MKKLKIAVIDNGVNCNILSSLLGCEVNIHAFQMRESGCVPQLLLANENGNYGTLCIALLLEFLEKTPVLIVRILQAFLFFNDDLEQKIDELYCSFRVVC